MSAETSLGPQRPVRQAALELLATSAARNIPGVDYVSVTLHRQDHTMLTVTATDPLATQADDLQYELHEGPCYSAVTDERFVLVNDLDATPQFPLYSPKARALGVGAQAAVQLLNHDGERAGLNLYASRAGAFDDSTVHIAELFATHAGALLGYAQQVEQLSAALHTRSDIGTAIGILMERYKIDQSQAFAFLSRNSQNRNVKLRALALELVQGTFDSTPEEHRDARSPI